MNQWVQLESFGKGPVKKGQVCEVYGIPVDWILDFPEFDPQSQYVTGDIVAGWQKYWLRFNVAASGKGFEETTRTLKGRTYWEQTFKFRLNWQSGRQNVKLQNMTNHRWVFLFREGGTGLYYLVGKPPVGAELTINYSNGQNTVTDIQIKFQSIHRAPLYTGVNRGSRRIADGVGNFLVDADGNYICTVGDPIMAPPVLETEGEFSNDDFSNEFFVPWGTFL